VDKTDGLEVSSEEAPGSPGAPFPGDPAGEPGPFGSPGPCAATAGALGPCRAWLLTGLYAAAVAAPPVLAMLSGQAFDGENPIYQAGRCCALSAIMILALQVVLAGRFAAVERSFGLDALVRFHRRMAVGAGVLLLAHPVLLALGGEGFEIFTALNLPWYIWLAKAALALLAANLLTSLFQRKLSLGFEGWRVLHDLLGPAVVLLAFIHSWFVEGGFTTAPAATPFPRLASAAHHALAPLWLLTVCSALALMAWHRLVRPRLLARRPYTVTAVRLEAPGVWTLELAPPKGETFAYLPGQFQFLTLKRGRNLPEEEHHFTISSSPAQRRFVSATIKEAGDFTATIGRTQPGDKAVVQAPFGRFSYLAHPGDENLVFLAGGIGVTPLMGMLRHMRDTASNLPVTFLYANRTQADMVFAGELEDIRAGGHPRLKLVHVLSRPEPGWEGERGRLDEGIIRRACGDLTGKAFYVCGPPGLVAASLRTLKGLGVPSGRIRREFFSFLD